MATKCCLGTLQGFQICFIFDTYDAFHKTATDQKKQAWPCPFSRWRTEAKVTLLRSYSWEQWTWGERKASWYHPFPHSLLLSVLKAEKVSVGNIPHSPKTQPEKPHMLIVALLTWSSKPRSGASHSSVRNLPRCYSFFQSYMPYPFVSLFLARSTMLAHSWYSINGYWAEVKGGRDLYHVLCLWTEMGYNAGKGTEALEVDSSHPHVNPLAGVPVWRWATETHWASLSLKWGEYHLLIEMLRKSSEKFLKELKVSDDTEWEKRMKGKKGSVAARLQGGPKCPSAWVQALIQPPPAKDGRT